MNITIISVVENHKLQKTSGLITERLIEISSEYFIGSSIIQTFMGFDDIVEINTTQ